MQQRARRGDKHEQRTLVHVHKPNEKTKAAGVYDVHREELTRRNSSIQTHRGSAAPKVVALANVDHALQQRPTTFNQRNNN